MSSTSTNTRTSNDAGGASATSVKKSIVVNVPIAHAFDVFTRRFDLWWPRSHHIGLSPMKQAVMEEREGGRWYEKGDDGSECEWGRVLAWSPPNKVALSWQINGAWQYEPDPSKGSRVEITFFDEGGGRTRVELEHSQLDRHGDDWMKLKESVGSDGGWSGLLEMFRQKATELFS